MPMRKSQRTKLENEFNAIRQRGRQQGGMKVQQYLDALAHGMKKGLTGEEYIRYASRIFSVFQLDLNFGQIADAVIAPDETASSRVFKKEMQRLLRENGTPEDHYLLKQ